MKYFTKNNFLVWTILLVMLFALSFVIIRKNIESIALMYSIEQPASISSIGKLNNNTYDFAKLPSSLDCSSYKDIYNKLNDLKYLYIFRATQIQSELSVSHAGTEDATYEAGLKNKLNSMVASHRNIGELKARIVKTATSIDCNVYSK